MTTTPAAPSATGHTDASPCPRIDATFTPPADVVWISVYRSSAAGKELVRAAYWRPVTAGGPMVVTDFEAPFGTPVTYSLIGYNAATDASAESAASNPVTLNVTGCPWASDPSNPSMAMTWTVVEWPQRTYARDMSQLWPLVSDTAVVVTARRAQPASAMEVITRTGADASVMRALADTPVVQVRTPASWFWRGGYFAMGELTETPMYFDATDPSQQWHVELIPTGRPDPTLFFPVYTWATVKALYPTWAALATAKATWLEVMRNPDPGAP